MYTNTLGFIITKRISRRKKNMTGFTLLEILLSLSIVMIVLLYFISYTQKEQQRSSVVLAKTQINGLLNAATQYHITYSQWPSSLNALIPFLSATSTKTPSFCSPWFTSTGCAAYTIANQSNYFALQVTVSNSRSAQSLVTALPNAYISSGTTVVAYTTAFVGFLKTTSPPVPTGIMYGTTPVYWHDGNGAYVYGLPSINWPGFRFEYVSGQKEDKKNFYFSPQSQACPSGSQATMLLFPAGNSPDSPPGNGFFYNYSHYWASASNSTAGPCSRAHLDDSLSTTNGNYFAAMDVVCLNGSAVTNWPDIMSSGSSCY